MSGFTSVLIVGATGYVGELVTQAFLNEKWNVSILTSPESLKDEKKKKRFDLFSSQGASIISADIKNPQTYKDKITGIDVLISALGVEASPEQQILAKAAKEAGVKLFVPSEYGLNIDEIDLSSVSATSVFRKKVQTRREIEKIGINYLYVATGPFYEYLLGWDAWGTDLKKNVVSLIGERSLKITSAPFKEVAEILPKVVNDPKNVNKNIFFGSQLTAGQLQDATLAALKKENRENISTPTITIESLKEKIANDPANSFGAEILLPIASGKSYDANKIDETKYRKGGKSFTSIEEFAPLFIAGKW